MPYFYIDTENKQIVVDSKKIKELIVAGVITAKTIIGSTTDTATRPAGSIPQLGDAFAEHQRQSQIQPSQRAPSETPAAMPSATSVPTIPVPNNESPPEQSGDNAMMMAMMKELVAAKSQPQIVITNTSTNTNTNPNDGAVGVGTVSYSLVMGFLIWFFFGWCMGGTCYLGRYSSLIVVVALILAIATAGVLGIVFYIADFVFVLLTAINKPPTDCHGRKAVYI